MGGKQSSVIHAYNFYYSSENKGTPVIVAKPLFDILAKMDGAFQSTENKDVLFINDVRKAPDASKWKRVSRKVVVQKLEAKQKQGKPVAVRTDGKSEGQQTYLVSFRDGSKPKEKEKEKDSSAMPMGSPESTIAGSASPSTKPKTKLGGFSTNAHGSALARLHSVASALQSTSDV